MRPRLVPAELLRRIGEHTGRAVGEGVEFAGIRPYVPGDQLRDINRAVSIRRGQLHVNQRAAARAADLVVMIDAFGERRARWPTRALDVAVHGAAALVTAYLRVSDRAGLVVLGGLLRWLGPAAGDRQFYRIAEMMLRPATTASSPPTSAASRAPRCRRARWWWCSPRCWTPAGSSAITDLRQRGFPLIVVDTLRDEPPASAARRQPGVPRKPGAADLALRLWRLDRAATRAALRDLGVPVLRWDRRRRTRQRASPRSASRPPASAAPWAPPAPAPRPSRRPAHELPGACGAAPIPMRPRNRLELPETPLDPVRRGTVFLGLLTVGWPLAWAPAWAYAVGGLGVDRGARRGLRRWRRGPALAVAAAVACCAVRRRRNRRPGRRGLFILGYLLVRRRARAGARSGQWLRGPAAPVRGRPHRQPVRCWPPSPCTRRARPGSPLAGLAAAVAGLPHRPADFAT